MLIELPIQLVDKEERDLVGEDKASTSCGTMTMRIDCVEAVYENNTEGCILETVTGSNFVVMLSYKEMLDLWKKVLDIETGLFFSSYKTPEKPASKSKKTVECNQTSPYPVVTESIAKSATSSVSPLCRGCGGSRFEMAKEAEPIINSTGKPRQVKRCLDCGYAEILD